MMPPRSLLSRPSASLWKGQKKMFSRASDTENWISTINLPLSDLLPDSRPHATFPLSSASQRRGRPRYSSVFQDQHYDRAVSLDQDQPKTPKVQHWPHDGTNHGEGKGPSSPCVRVFTGPWVGQHPASGGFQRR